MDSGALERIMSDIAISIIILNYRSWSLISNCIDSIYKYPPKNNYEVIVVDNYSNDNQINDFIKQYSEVKCVQNKGNFGYSSGCNLGAVYARGKYLLFLNPDTEFIQSPAIDVMIEYASKHNDVGIISCRKIKPGNKIEREITFINPWLTLGVIRSLYKVFYKGKIEEKLPSKQEIWHPEWLTGSIFFIPTDVFKQVDGLSEKDYWLYFEEMDIAHKINAVEKTITLIRNVEIKHQHGGSSRINPITSSITKSEVMISRHVYIQKHTSGVNRFLLHAIMLLIGLSSKLIMAIASIPLFWTKKGKTSLLLLIQSLSYYLKALLRKSWKSSRLNKSK